MWANGPSNIVLNGAGFSDLGVQVEGGGPWGVFFPTVPSSEKLWTFWTLARSETLYEQCAAYVIRPRTLLLQFFLNLE